MATIVLIPVGSPLGFESAEFVVAASAFPTAYLVGSAAGKRVTGNDKVEFSRKCAAGYFTPLVTLSGDDKAEVFLGVGTWTSKLISGNIGLELE